MDPLSVIESIYCAGAALKKMVDDMASNRKEGLELEERIERLMPLMKTLQQKSVDELNLSLILPSLNRLGKLIQDSNDFISRLPSKRQQRWACCEMFNWTQEAWSSTAIRQQFTELNNKLDQIVSELSAMEITHGHIELGRMGENLSVKMNEIAELLKQQTIDTAAVNGVTIQSTSSTGGGASTADVDITSLTVSASTVTNAAADRFVAAAVAQTNKTSTHPITTGITQVSGNAATSTNTPSTVSFQLDAEEKQSDDSVISPLIAVPPAPPLPASPAYEAPAIEVVITHSTSTQSSAVLEIAAAGAAAVPDMLSESDELVAECDWTGPCDFLTLSEEEVEEERLETEKIEKEEAAEKARLASRPKDFIPGFVWDLRCGTMKEKEKALAALVPRLQKQVSDRSIFVDCGGIAPLRALLEDVTVSDASKENIALITNSLGNLLSALIWFLRNGTLAEKEKAAAGLVSPLARNLQDGDRITFVNARGIPALVLLLKDVAATDVTRENAVQILSRLVCEYRYASEIYDNDGIRPIIRSLRGGTAHTRQCALSGLGYISKSGHMCRLIVEEGLPAIVQLAKSEYLAANILFNMADNNSNINVIVKAGAVPQLLHLFQNGTTTSRTAAGKALARLSSSTEAWALMQAAGVKSRKELDHVGQGAWD